MLTLVFVLWLLAGLNWLRYRDVLYPGVIQAAEWAALMSLFWMVQDDFTPLHWQTFVVVGCGVAAFSMGSYAATFNHQPYRQANAVSRLPARFPARGLLLLVLVAMPLVAYRAFQFATEGPFEQLPLANLRYALTSENADDGDGYGGLKYFFTLAYFVAALQLLQHYAKLEGERRGAMFTALGVALVFGFLSSGRGILLWLIVTLVMIPVVLRQVSATRAGFFFALTAVFVFSALGVLTGRGGELGVDLYNNALTMGESLKIYLLGGVAAFDHMLRQGSSYDLGQNSFRALFAAMNAIGFGIQVKPLIQGYVEVPFPTNVYTIYRPYFLDFGVMALPCIQFMIGYGHGLLYKGATVRAPQPLFVFLYAVAFFPMIGQFFDDSYFSMLSLWGQYLLLGYVFLHRWARPVGSFAVGGHPPVRVNEA